MSSPKIFKETYNKIMADYGVDTTIGDEKKSRLLITSVCKMTDDRECATLALKNEIPEKIIDLLKSHMWGIYGYEQFHPIVNTIYKYLKCTDLKDQVIERFMYLELDFFLSKILKEVYIDDYRTTLCVARIIKILVMNNQITKRIVDCLGYYIALHYRMNDDMDAVDYLDEWHYVNSLYVDMLVAICNSIMHILKHHPRWRFYNELFDDGNFTHIHALVTFGSCAYIKKYPQSGGITKIVENQQNLFYEKWRLGKFKSGVFEGWNIEEPEGWKLGVPEEWKLGVSEDMKIFLDVFMTLQKLDMNVKISDIVSIPSLYRILVCFLFCHQKLMGRHISVLCVEEIFSNFRDEICESLK